jgi:hypothetical protein
VADSTYVKVVGHEKIFRALRELEKKAATAITRKVLRHASKTFQTEVKARLPKRSGLLNKSVKVRATKRKRGKVGVQVVMGGLGLAKKGSHKLNKLANETFYGAFFHFGHKIGARSSRRKVKVESVRKAGQKGRLKQFDYIDERKSVPGNPVLENAYKAKGPELQKALPKMFWDEIRKAARQARSK